MNFKPDDIVKSCRKLESGLRLGSEGIHACQLGPFCAPIWWSGADAAKLKITKKMITQKRKELFLTLNDEISDIPCKQCSMVFEKPYKDVKFTNLGHIDVAADTICNLRCSYCGYAIHNSFAKAEYDPLAILKEFSPDDVEWDSAVDFNGGEPTLLENLNEYIDYFNNRRIRIFFYTNAVIFKQYIYDALMDGSISWIVCSLDAGTPSSFKKIKKRDKFFETLQTLTRYAHAGANNGGKLAVKYIFTEDNCSDDDIAGFTYTMLAIRPQKVWLTFDFEPLQSIPGNLNNLGGYDYSKHINAYAKMYGLMKKHGLEAGHFTENHLAVVSHHGEILMKLVKNKIARSATKEEMGDKELLLKNFREVAHTKHTVTTTLAGHLSQTIQCDSNLKNNTLKNKRLLLAPTCQQSIELTRNKGVKQGHIIGFLDRDTTLQGKNINGLKVYDYAEIPQLSPDIVLVRSSEQHHPSILATIKKFLPETSQVIIVNN